MRLRFRHIKAWLLHPAALLCLALSSCVYDDGTEPDTPGNPSDLMVSFTLRMERSRSGREIAHGTTSAAGRTSDYDGSQTWGTIDPTDPGNDFDNRLLKEHFHMLLLENETNKVVGKIEHDNMDVLIYDPYEDYTIVQFWGVLDTNLSTEELSSDDKYKVMIFANGDNGCAAELGDELAGDGITFSHIGQPGDKNSSGRAFDAIPMWGVAEAKLAGIKPGKQHDLGTVDMLRSMAKIIVDVDDEKVGVENNVRITSLTLEHYNTAGNILPLEWSKTMNTKDLKIDDSFNPNVSPATTALMPEVAESGKSVEFYVPEYDNKAEAEFLLTVGYTVEGSDEEKQGEIHICKYENGQPAADYTLWPIVRNHIYHYTITKVQGDEPGFRFKATIENLLDGGIYDYEYDVD